MEKRINLLFGIIGGLILIYINKEPIYLSTALGSFRGYVTDFIFPIISFIGFILVYYFCILLILEVIRTLHYKK